MERHSEGFCPQVAAAFQDVFASLYLPCSQLMQPRRHPAITALIAEWSSLADDPDLDRAVFCATRRPTSRFASSHSRHQSGGGLWEDMRVQDTTLGSTLGPEDLDSIPDEDEDIGFMMAQVSAELENEAWFDDLEENRSRLPSVDSEYCPLSGEQPQNTW
eukprot:TRINITY_DN3810_c0_g1_i3.p1 TRINITY_DN3810_c0_g1~~TRINITY_DN3810_c0_g1_i3.p1  ORF type:complete len:160 (-),score=21.28 TRINITY_DN3810_c0_g1_i3:518-997(-)